MRDWKADFIREAREQVASAMPGALVSGLLLFLDRTTEARETGKLRDLADLSDDETAILGLLYAEFLRRNGERREPMTEPHLYWACLSEYGIACNHPTRWRVADLRGRYYECGACRSVVMIPPEDVVQLWGRG